LADLVDFVQPSFKEPKAQVGARHAVAAISGVEMPANK
jgi:hypothetical protein